MFLRCGIRCSHFADAVAVVRWLFTVNSPSPALSSIEDPPTDPVVSRAVWMVNMSFLVNYLAGHRCETAHKCESYSAWKYLGETEKIRRVMAKKCGKLESEFTNCRHSPRPGTMVHSHTHSNVPNGCIRNDQLSGVFHFYFICFERCTNQCSGDPLQKEKLKTS